jgi:hypothetical protein
VRALVEMAAEGRGAAERDGAQGAALRPRQSMALLVPRTDPADDLAERDAGRHRLALRDGVANGRAD